MLINAVREVFWVRHVRVDDLGLATGGCNFLLPRIRYISNHAQELFPVTFSKVNKLVQVCLHLLLQYPRSHARACFWPVSINVYCWLNTVYRCLIHSCPFAKCLVAVATLSRAMPWKLTQLEPKIDKLSPSHTSQMRLMWQVAILFTVVWDPIVHANCDLLWMFAESPSVIASLSNRGQDVL